MLLVCVNLNLGILDFLPLVKSSTKSALVEDGMRGPSRVSQRLESGLATKECLTTWKPGLLTYYEMGMAGYYCTVKIDVCDMRHEVGTRLD